MSETMPAAADAGTADDDLRDDAALLPADTQDDGAEDAIDDDEQQPEPEEIEEIELSFGAKKLKVAKGSIPEPALAALTEMSDGMNADYTRKTQEVAEQRKAVEGERELYQKLNALKGEAMDDVMTGRALARDIAQFETLDLRALRESNPDQARWVSDELAMKRAEYARQVEKVDRHLSAMEAEEQRAIAKLEEAGRAEMRKSIKGFDESGEKAMIEYAVKNGIPESDAKRWPLNPKTAAMAWKAMQFDALQAKSKTATAARAPIAPSAPVKAVAAKASPSGRSPDQMTDDEYYRWEQQQAIKRRMGR